VKELSPAAQAVLDAYGDFEPANVDAMVAALRAAASQLTSAKSSDKLRAIAAELKGHA
jgi:hypothetical protein